MVTYVAPWIDAEIIRRESLDMIYSQAVLEHVDDLHGTCRAMHLWLKPGGFISHQIDFSSHGLAEGWNGHWTYSDLVWKLMRGRRPFLLNREPHSTYIKQIEEAGFEIHCDQKVYVPSPWDRKHMAGRFRDISEEDLNTMGAFVQAVKQSR
jgi:hypothetical protein